MNTKTITRGKHAAATEPTEAQYALLGRYTAALLGSCEDWDGGDICEAIAEHAANLDRAGGDFPGLGDQDADELKLWRTVADELGIEHDGEEDDVRECDNCGDEVATLSARDFCDGCEEQEARA